MKQRKLDQVYTPLSDNANERLARFETFRASLCAEDRIGLDDKLARWVDTIKARRPASQFSIGNARELFVALMDFGGYER